MKKLPFPLDYSPGKYADCRFCRGRGCPGCDAEAAKDAERLEKEYTAQFPSGPPCVRIPMDRLQDSIPALHADSIRKAFGPGGGGVKEVFANLEKAGFGKPVASDFLTTEKDGE